MVQLAAILLLTAHSGSAVAQVAGSSFGEVVLVPAGNCSGPLPTVGFADQQIDFSIQGPVTTDPAGNFQYSVQSNEDYVAELRGSFVDVGVGNGGTRAQHSGDVTSSTPGAIDWANARLDERTAFHTVNRAHAFAKSIDIGDPSFIALDALDVPVPVFVNSRSPTSSNLFCSGVAAGPVIHMCKPNSVGNAGEQPDVVAHEYGHVVALEVWGGPSLGPLPVSEGNADLFAALLLEDPRHTAGVPGKCDFAARNAANGLDFRFDDITGHHGGQMLSGFVWDAYQELGGDPTARDVVARIWLKSLRKNEATMDAQVLEIFRADDPSDTFQNPGNPANAQHHAELCTAAARHGFDDAALGCPAIQSTFPNDKVQRAFWWPEPDGAGKRTPAPARGVAGYHKGGLEYAVLALDDRIEVIDVTSPSAPRLVGGILSVAGGGGFGGRREVAIVGDYAYVVSGGGAAAGPAQGLVVVDLTQVDVNGGSVTASPRLGIQFAKDVTYHASTSTVYLAGADTANGGLQALNVSDPDMPSPGPTWENSTGTTEGWGIEVHVPTEGPYQGQPIGYFLGGSEGIHVLKLDAQAISAIGSPAVYPLGPGQRATTHAALDAAGSKLFVGDYEDEQTGAIDLVEAVGGVPSRTYVFDLADPSMPSYQGTHFGLHPMRDRALQRVGPHLFQVASVGGLRILDARGSVAMNEVGFFGTYPNFPTANGGVLLGTEGDVTLTGGAVAVDASLPSGTVLVADSLRGLFILDPGEAVFVAASIEPPVAPAGTPFEIHGAGFVDGSTTVTIGGLAVNVTWLDSRTLSGTIPASFVGQGEVVVTRTPLGAQSTVNGGFAIPAACDLDGDGTTTAADVLLARRIVVDGVAANPVQIDQGDVAPAGPPAGDGKFDAADWMRMIHATRGDAPGVCQGL